MFEFIQGKLVELTPTFAILEAGNTGFFINISLYTFSRLKKDADSKLFVHQVIREDAHLLFGFTDRHEREIFRMLISVSGIGANTARMILSSLSPSEIEQAILEENVILLKSIKGIGVKTAQRLIVDLKDKVGKSPATTEFFTPESNTLREEALSALVMLGFSKPSVQKVIDQILHHDTDLTVEELIKTALKKL